MTPAEIKARFATWRSDWNLFAEEMLHVKLDAEQQAILKSCQFNKKTTVASGTARGKDFVSAVAALCFLYLTPKWDRKGNMIENTKVALTAPTDRQVGNIMVPEFTRLFRNARYLPGRLVGYDIRTENKEWFLTGFKADDTATEAWSGFHAVNTMFIVTEASGISETVFNAIEGNLQGNSRILIVFNPNVSTGYAANSHRQPGWNKFRLNSLTAPNVIARKNIIPGQVDYDWVIEKVRTWCTPISESEMLDTEGDFIFEGKAYRPNDLFRIKVLGLFPKVSEDTLIPGQWVELANERWKQNHLETTDNLRLGVDAAGMGRDSSVFAYRYGNRVDKLRAIHSGGKANHMEITGIIANELRSKPSASAFIDTIGEGAGIYSRLEELGYKNAISCKYSESAKDLVGAKLNDVTGVYEFANMRAYLFWCVRDWLNPANGKEAQLPPDEELFEEATDIHWKFKSDGSIIMEKKEDIIARIKRSPDKFDALANTFYPEGAKGISIGKIAGVFQ